jgi:hypothetical protein
MESTLEQALREAATLAGIVDLDALRIPEFAHHRAAILTESDIAEAISKMRDTKPNLWRQADWQTITDLDEYDKRDQAFRESLRRSRPVGNTKEFSSLDAARLSDDEMQSLSRHVSGRSNSWDRSILTRALARQVSENASLGGGNDAA